GEAIAGDAQRQPARPARTAAPRRRAARPRRPKGEGRGIAAAIIGSRPPGRIAPATAQRPRSVGDTPTCEVAPGWLRALGVPSTCEAPVSIRSMTGFGVARRRWEAGDERRPHHLVVEL